MAVPVKIEWSVEERQFSIKLKDDFGLLSTPDGQLLELHAEEWDALAEVIHRHLRGSEYQKKHKSKPEKHGQPWLEADDQRLRACFSAGLAVRAIAEEMNRSRGGIEARLARLGLVPFAPPPKG